MSKIIIGTAGHIDHGKTALIRALTGRDTDRLPEEKKRGITVDLGFTYFDMPDGSRAGIVDVPGHEKFIHNMAAGAAGMDLVLLVIAADEGIMPQTREHVDILEMLGVKHYIIVLSKCDLVDAEWLDLAEEEIRGELRGTPLEKTPLVRVSSVTGEGIETLKQKIIQAAEKAGSEEKKRLGKEAPARLPIDRVFTKKGFGTVVTGTVMEGGFRRGDSAEIFPLGKQCRIREIQVHGEGTEECSRGQRAALNLSGVEYRELSRGCVLAAPESITPARLVNVKMRILKRSIRTVKNQTRLHFYSGTSEIVCRAVPLEREEIRPGESGYVQLRMETEAALRPGDCFVVRFYSPLETIGGGVVLESGAKKEKRFRRDVIERLKMAEEGRGEELARRRMEEEAEKLALRVEEAVRDYLKRYPYRRGMPVGLVRKTVLGDKKKQEADAFLEDLVKAGRLKCRKEYCCLPGHDPAEAPFYLTIKEQLVCEMSRAGYYFLKPEDIDNGKTDPAVLREILRLLEEEREITELSGGYYTVPQTAGRIEKGTEELLDQSGKVTISQIRDLFGTSRKNARLILEYTDRMGMTKKEGAESERVDNR